MRSSFNSSKRCPMTDANPTHADSPSSLQFYFQRVSVALGLTLTTVILLVFAWRALDILLLIFAGILFGIFLHYFKCRVSRFTRLPGSISLVIVMLVVILAVSLFLMLLVPIIEEQAMTLVENIPEALKQLRLFLLRFSWGGAVVGKTDVESLIQSQDGSNLIDALQNVAGIFSITIGVVFATIFIIIIGVYFAAEEETYFNGIIHLVPFHLRPRTMLILERLGYILRWWLLGQATSMAILGSLVFLGLYFLDVPYSVVLAMFTAIMTFVPNLGPIIAYFLTALVTLTDDPYKLIYVTLFFTFIQSIEGFFITPMIHRKAVTVPPMLIIAVQALLLELIGILGVLLAMPLVACAMILIQMIYVEGILGDQTCWTQKRK